jgi:glycolate oxidase FAD binding subunit
MMPGFGLSAGPAKQRGMDRSQSFRPQDGGEISEFLRSHADTGETVAVRGGGSKAGFGPPPAADELSLDLTGISGITLYEPDELVLTARAGTPLAEIAAALADRNQCMAFEPPDFGSLFESAGMPTLGGAVASGWSGPRRIRSGAVRDHVLGIQAIGGDGIPFKSGGRVVKNVTGFDLPKLLTGSHGTLAVMTEITIRVMPAPQASRTLLVSGLSDAAGLALLTEALGGPFELSGAAHLPVEAAARSAVAELADPSATLLRLEGFGPSVAERVSALQALAASRGNGVIVDSEVADAVWGEIRNVALVAPGTILWRLSLAATDAAATVAAIGNRTPVEPWYDWGGSLAWLALPPGAESRAGPIRGLLPSGHATLFRAPAAIRAATDVFQPRPPSLGALDRQVKAAFDPGFVLGPRHMRFVA